MKKDKRAENGIKRRKRTKKKNTGRETFPPNTAVQAAQPERAKLI